MNIERAIESECEKLICRHHRTIAQLHAQRRRFEKVTGLVGGESNLRPSHWAVADQFDPYKVRRKSRLIAGAIKHNLVDGTYVPLPALIREVPKPGGGKRQISIFPVADAALGTVCFRRIARRNQHRLAASSYAFRQDVGVHEAIERLSRELAGRNRFWLVEFDFSKYFDTISHEYLLETLPKYFRITKTEQQVIERLLGSERAFEVERYRARQFSRSTCGVPQGSSLSLFLANVACHELDLALARTSAISARYADDILVLCRTSDEADGVAELVLNHCSRAGLSVNFSKSDGITQFGPEWASHEPLREGVKAAIDYLGHRFLYRSVNRREYPAPAVVRRLSIRPRSLAKIRARVSNIIYSHLLRYPRRGQFRNTRIDEATGVDWDLVTCINDLRDYLYGGIPEDEIRSALGDRRVRLHLNRSVMAFYPLVDDVEQLRILDGWLVNALSRAISEREWLLRNLGIADYVALAKEQLVRADWYDHRKFPVRAGDGSGSETVQNDVRLPSFVRIWKYSRRCLNAFNLSRFPSRRDS